VQVSAGGKLGVDRQRSRRACLRDHADVASHRPGSPWVAAPEVPDNLSEAEDALADDARLEAVRLSGAWVQESLEGVEISSSVVRGLRLTGSSIDGLHLNDVVVTDCELSGVTLTASIFRGVRFERCRMSGLVAAELNARHVQMTDCQMDGAWFRMASFVRCEFSGCDLRDADFYAANLKDVRLLHSTLDNTEWSKAALDNVALHGSSLDGLRGVKALRRLVIGSDQLLPLAIPILNSLGIVVDDAYLDSDD
jgi:uncharacterized protein YjbI with pentapeptide repeats